MKRILSILLLTFLFSLAAQATDFYAGAWWDTKVDTFRKRGAGELRIWAYDNKTVLAEFYFNGVLLQSGTGTWSDTGNLFRKKIIIVAQGGQILRGTLNTFSGFAAGSYRGGGDTGKWQALDP